MNANVLREQLFGKMIDSQVSLEGKVVIVTGSNAGLGFETAVQLANLKAARIILAVRDVTKGESAAAIIRSKSHHEAVDVWHLDLCSFSSVKAFAAKCEDELDRLDVLVENAGMFGRKWQQTEDGWETCLQTNVIGTGLLALLLLPLLAKTAEQVSSTFKPHLTLVGSEVYQSANFNERRVPGSVLAALNEQKNFKSIDRYATTKLLHVFLARKISQLPIAKNIVVNVVNPGLCVSDLRRELLSPAEWILNKIARSTSQGAKNITWGAVQNNSPGAYISVCSEQTVAPRWTSPTGKEVESRIWGELCSEWKKVSPDLVDVV